jgi:hypothetical protein
VFSQLVKIYLNYHEQREALFSGKAASVPPVKYEEQGIVVFARIPFSLSIWILLETWRK